MREENTTLKIYTYSELNDEAKEKVLSDLLEHNILYEHCMTERMDTLKAFAELLNARLDYSIGMFPDRGEYIKLTPLSENDKFDFSELKTILKEKKDCPLTGVCYDHDLLDFFNLKNCNASTVNNALNGYLESIHNEVEAMCENEYIQDLCDANNYEFLENGEFYA